MHTCLDESTLSGFSSVQVRLEITNVRTQSEKWPKECLDKYAVHLRATRRTESNRSHKKIRRRAGEKRPHTPESSSNHVLRDRGRGWSFWKGSSKSCLRLWSGDQRAAPDICSACCAAIIS